MIENLNWPATLVFVFFFAVVTVMGFLASRWKSGPLDVLHEWGLGGRRFGAWITWFLLGGDLYTAYTVIAVPALIYAIGAYGFFAVPYTILIYPLLFVAFPRLWAVAHRHEYITAGDFILGRYGDKWLALAVCATGIVATMPYIALQLVGMERVIQALGFHGEGIFSHLPLTIAFVILALYTYSSGLRAPAMIAFVKDTMIYIFVIAAVVYIPTQLGGYGAIFDAAGAALDKKVAASGGKVAAGLILKPAQIMPFITLAIGSAMALFLYPHSMTGILAASNGNAIRRNAIALPAYSLVLGLIALMGYMAHAAGIQVSNPQDAVPQLFLKMFPSWFAGFTFAAIAIGALVPAAVMSIGAANTFTRNFWKSFIDPNLTPAKEAGLAKLVSLIVKLGALLILLVMPTQFAIDLQLLGGVWMIQIFPALIFGLYTRWFTGPALLVGWAVGTILGTWLSWGATNWTPASNFFGWLSFSSYNGLTSVIVNMIVAAILSPVLRGSTADQTTEADYQDRRVPA
ncbi:MAG: sodium:solute symporter family protein [Hyphomicrobiales bacterium]|nr:sodium:solute symporter family protein [Hyphomicrobiales bacterium]MBV9430493.1 sodium:solute symporter family protein [Hyphomicrobiales bacterium]